MTTGASRNGDEASIISFHRLHYGKLAEGADRRIPPSSGYAVTRRSRGLGPAWDEFLSPLRLTGLRRFEPDAIDIDARATGCLIARAIGENMVLMRARFRPEDGENGFGRLHQQAAVWIGAQASWRHNPAGWLAVATRELQALPDLLAEAEAARMNEAPIRWRVARPDNRAVLRIVEHSPWAAAMLETLLAGAGSGADALIDFGAHDFANEGDFLAAVGFALQVVPQAYPRWRDISIVSGLANPLPGLCFRYVPSWARRQAAA